MQTRPATRPSNYLFTIVFALAMPIAEAKAQPPANAGAVVFRTQAGLQREATRNWAELRIRPRHFHLGPLESIVAIEADSEPDADLGGCPMADDDVPAPDSFPPRATLVILDLHAGARTGIALLGGPAALRRVRNLYGAGARGWLIGDVTPLSEARRAGLQTDDLVVEVNGTSALEQLAPPAGLESCASLAIRVVKLARPKRRARRHASIAPADLRVPAAR